MPESGKPSRAPSRAAALAMYRRRARLYDLELARLQRLWGGATPGSLGPLPNTRPKPQPGAM